LAASIFCSEYDFLSRICIEVTRVWKDAKQRQYCFVISTWVDRQQWNNEEYEEYDTKERTNVKK